MSDLPKVRIGGQELQARFVRKREIDGSWQGRESWQLDLELDVGEAAGLFHHGAAWAIAYEDRVEDQGEYRVAGPIVDHRDGTVTVRMGKPTEMEMLAAMDAAYAEGVQQA